MLLSALGCEEEAPIGEGQWKTVTVGREVGCVMRDDGTVRCWTYDTEDHDVDAESYEAPSGSFRSVSAGGAAACGITSGGRVECWGAMVEYGSYDPLPDGDDFTGPVAVSECFQIACGLAESSETNCWGNDTPYVGTGPPGPFSEIASGCDGFAATRPGGGVACWGYLDCGQDFPEDLEIVQIDAGPHTACGIGADTRIWCGTAAPDAEAPEAHPPQEPGFSRVAVGRDVACALDLGGALHCWGLGAEEVMARAPPVPLRELAYEEWTWCGITLNDHLACWGGGPLAEGIDFEP